MQGIALHIANILNDSELDANSVVKNYLTTAAEAEQTELELLAIEEKIEGREK
jgi:hypothetical protein